MNHTTPQSQAAYDALQVALKAHRDMSDEADCSSHQALGEKTVLVCYRVRGGSVHLEQVYDSGYIVPVCEFALPTQIRWIKSIQRERME